MKETEILLSEINRDIKEMLSDKRYTHSVNVMKRSEELAKKFGVGVPKCLREHHHQIGRASCRERV